MRRIRHVRETVAAVVCATVVVACASGAQAQVDSTAADRTQADSTPAPSAPQETSAAASSVPADSAPASPSASAERAPTAADRVDLQRQIQNLQAQLDMLQRAIAARDSNYVRLVESLTATKQELTQAQQRLDQFEQLIPNIESTRALQERLAVVEQEAKRVPELPPDVVSAGDFPGSIRIPRTNAAIKFGARVRFASVFTMGPLGSEDRFLTYSIPVEGTPEAGKGPRTSFNASASRINFDLRTPTDIGEMRAFLEGDFAGDKNAFRMRHAYGQYGGFIFGQTSSTFSDPAANPEDIDFEGVSSKNEVRQPQIRYAWELRTNLRSALAAELPEASITGGAGVNLVPDLVGQLVWRFGVNGHLQFATVIRQIRGEATIPVGASDFAFGGGGGLSGVVPVQWRGMIDRIIFQVNGGVGTARYLNDLNSLGGQDAVFDSTTGTLHALPVLGWYVDYEHMWKRWGSNLKLRSSIIWSFVEVDNLDIQPGEAYARTNRFVANMVFSPEPKLDIGVEYIYGTRENKDGASGSSSQIQFVALFLF